MRFSGHVLRALGTVAVGAGFAISAQAAALNPPQISGISPDGLVQPGQQVTLTGTNFSDTGDCNLSAPTIGIHPLDGGADYSLSPDQGHCSPTSILVTLPGGHAQWSAAELWVADNHNHDSRGAGRRPILTLTPTASISPSHGQVGTTFTISGSNLDPPSVVGPLHISFPSTDIASGWGNSISNLNPGNQPGDVALSFSVQRDAADASATARVTVAAGHYSFDAPTISGLSPDTTTVGQVITFAGNNLGTQPGSVQFTGLATRTSAATWTSQQVTATVPPGAQDGPIHVDVPGFTGSVVATDLKLLPLVKGIAPAQATPGSAITVSGFNFGACAGPAFASCLASMGGAAQAVTAWSDQSVTFTLSPDVDPGPVRLSRADGKTADTPALSVLPKLTQLEQNNVQPGAVVVVDGVGLGSQQGTVSLAHQTLTPQLWSRTSVLVQVPSPLAPGKYDLVVVNASGQSSNALPLTIAAPPPSPKPGSSAAAGAAAAANPTQPHFDNKHDFVKPIPPPSPVRLTLDAEPKKVAPGGVATLTVTLQLNGKPVNGAQVKLSLIFSPCSQDAFSLDHGTTDSSGTFKSSLTLCSKPGQRVILAESGLFSDQDAVVAAGAKSPASSSAVPVNPASGLPVPLLALGGVALALVAAGVFVNLRSHGWI